MALTWQSPSLPPPSEPPKWGGLSNIYRLVDILVVKYIMYYLAADKKQTKRFNGCL